MFEYVLILLIAAASLFPLWLCHLAVKDARRGKSIAGSKAGFHLALGCFTPISFMLVQLLWVPDMPFMVRAAAGVYIVLGICILAWTNNKIDKLKEPTKSYDT